MGETSADFIAGVIGGTAGLFVGHPLDVVRIRMQTAPIGTYRSVAHCFSKTFRQEGLTGLYRGLLPPVAGVSFLNAILFTSYGLCRRFLQPDAKIPLTYSQIFLAGGAAGFTTCSVSAPTELLKCRMQVEGQIDPSKHMSTWTCAQDIYRQKGLAGFTKGFVATCARDIPSFGVYFVTYEVQGGSVGIGLVRTFLPARLDAHAMTWAEGGVLVMAGGVAGVVGWASVYPIDVIKSRLQVQDLRTPQFHGMLDCSRFVLRTEGASGFFRGLNATLLRAFPLNGVTFLGYEWSLRYLQKMAIFSKHDSY